MCKMDVCRFLFTLINASFNDFFLTKIAFNGIYTTSAVINYYEL